MHYLVSTSTGWFYTTDEALQSKGYTVETMINKLKDDSVNKLYFVNRKPANTREYKYEDFWEFGNYV